MTTTITPDPVAVLLADVMLRGIIIQAHGDKLQYRPRDRMTPELAHRLKAHKDDLLAVLAACCGIDLSNPRLHAAHLIRQARQVGDYDGAVAHRDAWRERVAICTAVGGLTLEQAERIAIDELVCAPRSPLSKEGDLA